MRAREFRELDSEHADTASGTADQHGVAGSQLIAARAAAVMPATGSVLATSSLMPGGVCQSVSVAWVGW